MKTENESYFKNDTKRKHFRFSYSKQGIEFLETRIAKFIDIDISVSINYTSH